MARTKYLTFHVKVPKPEIYDAEELREFIQQAVQCWGGQRHPDDELFDLCRDAEVKRVGKSKGGEQ